MSKYTFDCDKCSRLKLKNYVISCREYDPIDDLQATLFEEMRT